MEGTMPKKTTIADDGLELSPERAAALARWLSAANERLLSLERGRGEIITAAKSISGRLAAMRADDVRARRPKPGARIAKAG
jgi:hypothetical protein